MDERYQRTIMTEFPAPIAKRFTRLRTPECRADPARRCDEIFATGETITRFLAAVALCASREMLERTPCNLPASFSKFGEQLGRPAWGFWLPALAIDEPCLG